MFTVTAISVDRLLALMLQLRYRRIVTLKRVRVFVSVSWLASSAAAMMFFYDRAVYVVIGITSMALILTSCASIFCYIKIYVTLRHHRSKVQNYFSLTMARFRKKV